MTLSVVIPAHGRQDLLIRCLESLRDDIDTDLNCEICVVDDGSRLDGDVIRARVVAGHSFIWKAFKKPKGRSAARNKGVRSTTGGIIIFLDSDMEVRPGFLRAHLECHKKSPHTAVVGGIDWPQGGSFLRYIGSRGINKLSSGDSVPPWYFVTGNASVERADLPNDHPFDETLSGWGGEDLALGMRLKSAGVAFASAPSALSYHHFDGVLSGHLKRTALYGRYALPVLVKRYPELESILKLDLLKSPLWRLLIHGLIRHPSALAATLLNPLPLPDFLFDYLTFAAYGSGWLKGKKRR